VIHDAAQIISNLPIFEPYLGQAPVFKNLPSMCIVLFLFRSIMATTIDFHHTSRFITVKISEKTFDYLLSPKLKPHKPVGADALPEFTLLRRHFFPQLACSQDFISTNPLQKNNTAGILVMIWFILHSNSDLILMSFPLDPSPALRTTPPLSERVKP
jgi:hypothetical protein